MIGRKLSDDGCLSFYEREYLPGGIFGFTKTNLRTVGIARIGDIDRIGIIDRRRNNVAAICLTNMPCETPRIVGLCLQGKARMRRKTSGVIGVGQVQPRLNVFKGILGIAQILKNKLLGNCIVPAIQLNRRPRLNRTARGVEHTMAGQNGR